jgi:hypothetical protein
VFEELDGGRTLRDEVGLDVGLGGGRTRGIQDDGGDEKDSSQELTDGGDETASSQDLTEGGDDKDSSQDLTDGGDDKDSSQDLTDGGDEKDSSCDSFGRTYVDEGMLKTRGQSKEGERARIDRKDVQVQPTETEMKKMISFLFCT